MENINLSRYELTAEECQMLVIAAQDCTHFKNIWKYLNHQRALKNEAPINRNWLFEVLRENGCKHLPESVDGFKIPSVLPKKVEKEVSDEVKEPVQVQVVVQTSTEKDPLECLSEDALAALHLYYRIGEISNHALKIHLKMGYDRSFLTLYELENVGLLKKNPGLRGRYHFVVSDDELKKQFPNQFRLTYFEQDEEYRKEEIRIREQQNEMRRAAGWVFDENDFEWYSPEQIKEKKKQQKIAKQKATWKRKHEDAKKKYQDDLERRFNDFVVMLRSQEDVDKFILHITSSGPNVFVNRMINMGMLVMEGFKYKLV